MHMAQMVRERETKGETPDAGLGAGARALNYGASAFRAPAFPYLVGAVFRLSGDSLTAARIVSALLGVVTVFLIGLIADRLWARRTALIAMAIAAVYPPLVLLSGTLLTESLALPLLLGMVLLVMEERAALAGLLFGLALLTRSASSVFVIPLVAGLWSMRSWRAAALAVGIAALTVVPWTIRNASDFHTFVPITTDSGFLLAGTYNPDSAHDPVEAGAYHPQPLVRRFQPITANPKLDEAQIEKRLRHAGRTYALDHPGYVADAMLWNSLRMLGLKHAAAEVRNTYAFQGIGPGWAHLARWSWYLIALAAIAGLVLGAARAMPWWLWVMPVVLLVSVVVISADQRYRIPIEPFVIWFAAYALTGRRRAQPPPPTTPQPR